MIVVQSPLKRDYIIELLTKEAHEGVTFTFVETRGMKLYFSVGETLASDAAAIAKKTIKGSEVGAALYFSVSYE